MSLQKAALALILSFVVTFSLAATIQIEKNNSAQNSELDSLTSLHQLTYTNPSFYAPIAINQINLENSVKAASPCIRNSTQTAIYDYIVANPGIQFRGICAGLSIAVGTAEFHLGVLKKAGLISFVNDGKYKRFFVSKKFSDKETKLISLLRHETLRKIVKKLVSEKSVPRGKLLSHLSITSQGLTWQMNRLRKQGIAAEVIDGTKITYSLNVEYEQLVPQLLNFIEK
jgi:predicted transcriptional regulator